MHSSWFRMFYTHDPTEIENTGSIWAFLVEFMLREFFQSRFWRLFDLGKKGFTSLKFQLGPEDFNSFYERA